MAGLDLHEGGSWGGFGVDFRLLLGGFRVDFGADLC